MDVLSLAIACVHRWYLVLPILTVTALTAFGVHHAIPAQLEANGQALLVGAEAGDASTARVVSLEEIASEAAGLAAQSELREGGSELTVRARGRELQVEVAGTDEDEVRRTSEATSRWLRNAVDGRQEAADIPPLERSTLQTNGDPQATIAIDGRASLVTTLSLDGPLGTALNPFGPTNNTVRTLAAAVNSDEVHAAVTAAMDADVTYSVAFRNRDPVPALQIRTVAADSASATRAYDHVVDVIELKLAELEDRAMVPSSARTSIERVSPPEQVIDIGPPLERPVAAVLGVGGLLALAAVLLAEALRLGWLTSEDDENIRPEGVPLLPTAVRLDASSYRPEGTSDDPVVSSRDT